MGSQQMHVAAGLKSTSAAPCKAISLISSVTRRYWRARTHTHTHKRSHTHTHTHTNPCSHTHANTHARIVPYTQTRTTLEDSTPPLSLSPCLRSSLTLSNCSRFCSPRSLSVSLFSHFPHLTVFSFFPPSFSHPDQRKQARF